MGITWSQWSSPIRLFGGFLLRGLGWSLLASGLCGALYGLVVGYGVGIIIGLPLGLLAGAVGGPTVGLVLGLITRLCFWPLRPHMVDRYLLTMIATAALVGALMTGLTFAELNGGGISRLFTQKAPLGPNQLGGWIFFVIAPACCNFVAFAGVGDRLAMWCINRYEVGLITSYPEASHELIEAR